MASREEKKIKESNERWSEKKLFKKKKSHPWNRQLFKLKEVIKKTLE